MIDPAFLFRFEIELRKVQLAWGTKGLRLAESCKVPSFGLLGRRPTFADVRIAWAPEGLAVHVTVEGKRQLPWCRATRPDESDGFHLWLDTRCSPNIHRATQYCHRFLFMPAGGGPKKDRPVARLLEINRARTHPKPVPPEGIGVHALPRHDGYVLSGIIPTASMTGYDPGDQRRIGFYYAVIDRELGWETLGVGADYPFEEDPALWAEAVLRD